MSQRVFRPEACISGCDLADPSPTRERPVRTKDAFTSQTIVHIAPGVSITDRKKLSAPPAGHAGLGW